VRSWRRTIVVGLVAIAALGIFAVVALRTFLRHEFTLTVLVDDSAGIAASSPVLINGIPIGHVLRVSLSGSKDPNRTVRIDMQFSRRYLADIPEDSTAGIAASNLLGDKYMGISRGTHSKHVEPGAELRASETVDINTVLTRGSGPLKQANDIFNRVDTILKYVGQNHGTVGRLVNGNTFRGHIEGITAAVEQMESDLDKSGAALHLTAIESEARKPMGRFHDMMADLDHGSGSAGRFLHDPYNPALTAEATAAVDEAKQLLDEFARDQRRSEIMDRLRTADDKIAALMARIDEGQGTAGQFLVSPRLRESVKRAEAELDSLIAGISAHPLRFVAIRFGLF
jgi:phospholipid/cholesterol/gamma-HCH transport system substrate-binding protein